MRYWKKGRKKGLKWLREKQPRDPLSRTVESNPEKSQERQDRLDTYKKHECCI